MFRGVTASALVSDYAKAVERSFISFCQFGLILEESVGRSQSLKYESCDVDFGFKTIMHPMRRMLARYDGELY